MEEKKRTIFTALLVLTALKHICCEICHSKYIAPTLYSRLFPQTVLNPHQRVHTIKAVPDSTCLFEQIDNSLVVTSNDEFDDSPNTKCTSVPSNTTRYGFGPSTVATTYLTIRSTNVKVLPKNAFRTWQGVEILEISMNLKLKRIVPGTFNNLINVWNLTISDNPNLGTLEPNTFKGLIKLRGLRYLRNNVMKLGSITPALRRPVLPVLTVLDFTGNNISRVEKDDFEPMRNSSINKLIISLTKTEWIHREAFDPLGPLVDIVLSKNNLNTSVLIDLLNHMKEKDFYLTDITLDDNALGVDPRPILEAVAERCRMLDLQNNHFGILNQGTFPRMPNLKYLDLTNVMIDDLVEGVLGTNLLPKLMHLYLGGNIFSGLSLSMVQDTIARLDMSFNENDLPWNTVFHIDPEVFIKMPHLELLDLSGNKIEILKNYTLNNTFSLKVLLLRNSNINEIEAGAFESCRKLFYLDLSSNIFPMVGQFNKEIFRGLSELLALDLSECGISNVPEDLFYYVHKLQFLSLRTNSIYQISPDVFRHTPDLYHLDMRYNILVTWEKRLFTKNPCLKKGRFDYNHIQTISKEMVQDFMTFNRVGLYANSIVCDCNFIETVASMLNYNMDAIDDLSFTTDRYHDINTCINEDSELLRHYLKMGDTADCINRSWVVLVSVGVVALTATSLILYVIYYYYRYDIHFWFLRTKRKLGLLHYIGSKKREKTHNFKYDAFVSYCSEDEKFVEKMVYILETDCSKFNLCVFERDFKVGDVLTDKILECMESSRHTILVLTESFAKSQWCCWEMYTAQSRSISLSSSEPNDPLILIKKSEIPQSLMTPTLRYLMKTRVYLEWHSNPVRQNIFWEQLKNALKTKGTVQNTET